MGLRLVNYDPNDHKLAEALALDDGHQLESIEKISQALSLCIAWKDDVESFAYLTKEKSSKVAAKISVDPEERTPSQLFINLPTGTQILGEFAYIRSQVFKNCFEYEVAIIDRFSDHEGEWMITEIPQKVSVVKTRRLPRIKSMEAKLTLSIGDEQICAQIVSISLKSFVVPFDISPSKQVSLHLHDQRIPCMVTRSSEDQSILLPVFENMKAYGYYFIEYCRSAYPGLKPRDEFAPQDITTLYAGANYFGTFQDKTDNERDTHIHDTWDKLKSGLFDTHIDMIACQAEELFGASGLAKAFIQDKKPVWAFHQLCAIKDPRTLELSASLYKWRAEFLAGMPEDGDSVVWFRSNSRWLERIYVKFTMNKPSSNIKAVKLTSTQLTHFCEENEIYALGDTSREYSDTPNITFAKGPAYLNASRLLDMVIVRKANSWMEIQREIRSKQAIQDPYIVVCTEHDKQIEGLEGSPLQSDRLASIPKSDLIDFISCLEHSMAITQMKLKNA